MLLSAHARNFLVRAAVLAFVCLLASSLSAQVAWEGWFTGIAQVADAKRLAYSYNRPLLVIAGGADCDHCNKFENLVLHTPAFQNYVDANKIVVFECRDSKELNGALHNLYSKKCGMTPSYPFIYIFKVNDGADLATSDSTSLHDKQVTLLDAGASKPNRYSGFNYLSNIKINHVQIETELAWTPETFISVFQTFFPNQFWANTTPPAVPTHTGFENAHDFGRIPNMDNPQPNSKEWIMYSGAKVLDSAATQNWFKFVGDLGKRYVFSAKDITNNNPEVEITFELFGSEWNNGLLAPLEDAYKTITALGFDALDRGVQIDMPIGTATNKTYFVRLSHAAGDVSKMTYTLKAHEAQRAPAAGTPTNPHWNGARPGKWTMDRAAAEEAAKAAGKPVIYLFSGLLWCPHCVCLEHKILQAPEFKAATADAYLVALDNRDRYGNGPSPLRDNTANGYLKTNNISVVAAEAKLVDNIAAQDALALPGADPWGPDKAWKKIGYPTLVYCVPAAAPTRATLNGLTSVGRIAGDYDIASVIAKLDDLALMAAAGFVEDNNCASLTTQMLKDGDLQNSRIGGRLITADWWRFTVPAGKAATITATGVAAPAGAAISLAVYAADGVTLLKTATSPATDPVRLVFAPAGNAEDTEYLLQVTASDTTASFLYELELDITAKSYVLAMADQESRVSSKAAEVKLRLNIETVNAHAKPLTFKCRLRRAGDTGAPWREMTIAHDDKATPYTFSMALPDGTYPDGESTELVAEIIESGDNSCQIDPEQSTTTVNVLGYAAFNYPADATFTLYRNIALAPGSLSFPVIGDPEGEPIAYNLDGIPLGLELRDFTSDPDNQRVEIIGTPEGEANAQYKLLLVLLQSQQYIDLTFNIEDLPQVSNAFAGYLVEDNDVTAAQAMRGDIKIDNDLDGLTGIILVRVATQDAEAPSFFEFAAWSNYSPDLGALNLIGLASTTQDGSALSLQISQDGTCTGAYTSPLGNSFAIRASAVTKVPGQYAGYYTVALRHWLDNGTYSCQGWLQVWVDDAGCVTYQGELIDGATFGPKDTYVTPGKITASNKSGMPDGEMAFFLPLGWSAEQNSYIGRLAGQLAIVAKAEREATAGDNVNDAWVLASGGNSAWEKAADDLVLIDPCGTTFDSTRSVTEQVDPDFEQPYFYISVQPTPPETAFAPGSVLPNCVKLEENRDALALLVATNGILSAELSALTYDAHQGTFTGRINVLKTADGSANGELARTECPIRGILTPITKNCCGQTPNLADGHGYFTLDGATCLVTIFNQAPGKTAPPAIDAWTHGDHAGTRIASDVTCYISDSDNNTVQLSVPPNAQILCRQVATGEIFLHSAAGADVLILDSLPALRHEFTAIEDGKAESDKATLRLYRQNDSLVTFKFLPEGAPGEGLARLRRGWNLIGIPQNFRTGHDVSKEIAIAALNVSAGVALFTYDQDKAAYITAETLTAGKAYWMYVGNDTENFTLPGVLLLEEDYAKESLVDDAWQFIADPGDEAQGAHWFWVNGRFTIEPPEQPAWQGVWFYK